MNETHRTAVGILFAVAWLGVLCAPRDAHAVCTSFAVSPTSISAAATAGTKSLTVTGSPSGCTGGSWTASSLSWATPSPASGSGSGTVIVSIAANPGFQRTGNLTVAGKTVSITQAAAAGSWCVQYMIAPVTNAVSAGAGSIPISVTGSPIDCNQPWTITSNDSWLTPVPSSGVATTTVNLFYTQNTGAARTGSVTFLCDYCSPAVTVSVTQAQGTGAPTCTSFSLSPATASASTAAGSQLVNIVGSPAGCLGGSWTASSGASWVAVSPTSGSGPGTTTVTWTQNTGGARTGTATIAGNAFTVSQAGTGGGSCVADASSLCLLNNRFRVTANYTDYGGNHGTGKAVPITSDTGYFWFFTSANVEGVLKMVSFCGGASPNVSVYATGLTDLAVNFIVTDTATGTSKTYTNALGNPFRLIRDGPFVCVSPRNPDERGEMPDLIGTRDEPAPDVEPLEPSYEMTAPAACTPNATSLCLYGNRFRVTATYKDYAAHTGTGQAVALTSDTGYFWFFNSANVETVIKIVSFCGGGSNKYAVYANGLTDLDVTLTVTDTQTGLSAIYNNPLGNLFLLIRDGAFACP